MTLTDTLTPILPPLRMDHDEVVRVATTRVTLDTIIGAYLDGATPEAIALAYDSLSLADIHAVISHYYRYRPEVERYLEQRRGARERVREAYSELQPEGDIRMRLLARQPR